MLVAQAIHFHHPHNDTSATIIISFDTGGHLTWEELDYGTASEDNYWLHISEDVITLYVSDTGQFKLQYNENVGFFWLS